jgi:hypothetical protein
VSFLHPLILAAGLAALSIPVLVHLLRRRRKPIPWAAMRFLQEAVRKRRRRLRLEQLLLFLARCAVVLLLALAVARPVLGGRPGSDRPTVLVLAIDDSIGSALTGDAGRTALTRNLERARAELDAVRPAAGDRVGLVTMGAPGRALVWPPTGDPDAVRRALDRLQPTDSALTLAALRRAIGEIELNEAAPERVVLRVISDWRGADPEALFAGGAIAGVDLALVDPPGPVAAGENIGIRAVLSSTPTVLGDGAAAALAPPTQVTVSLVRTADTGERLVDVEVIALPAGSIAGRARARFAPGQEEAQAVVALDDGAFTPGRGGRVALEARLPADANPRDNAARTVLTVRRELRVGVVERPPLAGADTAGGVVPGVWALAALTPDRRAGVDAFRIDPASLASVPAASVDALVVLEPNRLNRAGWTRARELLARGGLVVVVPDAAAPPVGFEQPLAELTGGTITVAPAGVRESDARLDSRVGAGSVLSGLSGEFGELARAVGVRRILALDLAEDARAALRTDDDAVFLAEAAGPDGRGVVAVFASAFDLGWTDLPARPAFVPVMQEIARRGAGLGLDGDRVAGAPPEEDAGVDRWVHDAELSAGPQPPGEPGGRAGVLVGLGRDGSVVRTLALNPDAPAARTRPASAENLRTAAAEAMPGTDVGFGRSDDGAEPVAAAFRATPAGDRVALLLLAAAAVIAVLEALLARAASHPEGGAA